jgi:hypothetical protein
MLHTDMDPLLDDAVTNLVTQNQCYGLCQVTQSGRHQKQTCVITDVSSNVIKCMHKWCSMYERIRT